MPSLSRFLQQFYDAVATYLLRTVKVQLILLLCSLPFLISWGLSISMLSVAGNIIFLPVITLYLALALLWCIGALCSLPTTTVSKMIEWLTALWIKGLSSVSSLWLFSLPCPWKWLLWCIPISALTLLWVTNKHTLRTQVAAYCMLTFTWCLALQLTASRAVHTIAHGAGALYIVPHAGGVTLVDIAGVLRSLPHRETWYTFTLKPLLAQQYGQRRCSTIALMKPSYRQLDAARRLIEAGVAPSISIPTHYQHAPWVYRWQHTYPTVPIQFISEQDCALFTHL